MSKIHCDCCNGDYAKSYYKKHLLSKKHLKNQGAQKTEQPKKEQKIQKTDYIVYLLKNTHGKRTYLGVTNNSEKRIKQHNGKIKGGAKYTRSFKGKGTWIYHIKISNLTKSEAHSMESLTKHAAKRNYKKKITDKTKTAINRKVDLLLSFRERFPGCEVKYF